MSTKRKALEVNIAKSEAQGNMLQRRRAWSTKNSEGKEEQITSNETKRRERTACARKQGHTGLAEGTLAILGFL